jgi:hypothetical protein
MLSHTQFYLQVAGFYFRILPVFGGFSDYHIHKDAALGFRELAPVFGAVYAAFGRHDGRM